MSMSHVPCRCVVSVSVSAVCVRVCVCRTARDADADGLARWAIVLAEINVVIVTLVSVLAPLLARPLGCELRRHTLGRRRSGAPTARVINFIVFIDTRTLEIQSKIS
jgi:hypothetical protein